MSGNTSNVCVAVRVRPFLPKEIIQLSLQQQQIASTRSGCVQVTSDSIAIQDSTNGFNGSNAFTFDHVLGPECSQLDMYRKLVLPRIEHVLSGYNVTLLAYGQTASGKTYTMGSGLQELQEKMDPSIGLLPRTLQEIFQRLDLKHSQLLVSFLEIYGEDIFDLLGTKSSNRMDGKQNPKSSKDSLQLRQDKSSVYVQNLTEVAVSNWVQVMEHLKLGCVNRITGSTEMNDTSSRSHAVFTITIIQNKQPTSQNNNEANDSITTTSKLTFVDLAGSERLKKTQAEGNRMKEGIQINVGLLALGNVINALSESKKSSETPAFVPYRSSKLTRLLQDALGGNSKTLFIACVSPSIKNTNETLSTLQYANRAKMIQNKAIKNIDAKSAELSNLRSLIHILEREVVQLQYNHNPTLFIGNYQPDDEDQHLQLDDLMRNTKVRQYLQSLYKLASNNDDVSSSSPFNLSSSSKWSTSLITTCSAITSNAISTTTSSNIEEQLQHEYTCQDLNRTLQLLQQYRELESLKVGFQSFEAQYEMKRSHLENATGLQQNYLLQLQSQVQAFKLFDNAKYEALYTKLQTQKEVYMTSIQQNESTERIMEKAQVYQRCKDVLKPLEEEKLLVNRTTQRLNEIQQDLEIKRSTNERLEKEYYHIKQVYKVKVHEIEQTLVQLRQETQYHNQNAIVNEYQCHILLQSLQLPGSKFSYKELCSKLNSTEKQMLQLMENPNTSFTNFNWIRIQTSHTSAANNTTTITKDDVEHTIQQVMQAIQTRLQFEQTEAQLSMLLCQRSDLLHQICVQSSINSNTNSITGTNVSDTCTSNNSSNCTNSNDSKSIPASTNNLSTVDIDLLYTQLKSIDMRISHIQTILSTMKAINPIEINPLLLQNEYFANTLINILTQSKRFCLKYDAQVESLKEIAIQTGTDITTKSNNSSNINNNSMEEWSAYETLKHEFQLQVEALKQAHDAEILSIFSAKTSSKVQSNCSASTNSIRESTNADNVSMEMTNDILLQKLKQCGQKEVHLKDDYTKLECKNSELLQELNGCKQREAAFTSLEKCQLLWTELGMSTNDCMDKIKAMGLTFQLHCDKEIETLTIQKQNYEKNINGLWSIITQYNTLLQTSPNEITIRFNSFQSQVTLQSKEQYLIQILTQYQQIVMERSIQRYATLQKAIQYAKQLQVLNGTGTTSHVLGNSKYSSHGVVTIEDGEFERLQVQFNSLRCIQDFISTNSGNSTNYNRAESSNTNSTGANSSGTAELVMNFSHQLQIFNSQTLDMVKNVQNKPSLMDTKSSIEIVNSLFLKQFFSLSMDEMETDVKILDKLTELYQSRLQYGKTCYLKCYKLVQRLCFQDKNVEHILQLRIKELNCAGDHDRDSQEAWRILEGMVPNIIKCLFETGGKIDVSSTAMYILDELVTSLSNICQARMEAKTYLQAALHKAHQLYNTSSLTNTTTSTASSDSSNENQDHGRHSVSSPTFSIDTSKSLPFMPSIDSITNSDMLSFCSYFTMYNQKVQARIKALLYTFHTKVSIFGMEQSSAMINFLKFAIQQHYTTANPTSTTSSSNKDRTSSNIKDQSMKVIEKHMAMVFPDTSTSTSGNGFTTLNTCPATTTTSALTDKSTFSIPIDTHQSFLHLLDPYRIELGPLYSRHVSVALLETLESDLQEYTVLVQVLQFGDMQLNSLHRILTLMQDVQQFNIEIQTFQQQTSDRRDRLLNRKCSSMHVSSCLTRSSFPSLDIV